MKADQDGWMSNPSPFSLLPRGHSGGNQTVREIKWRVLTQYKTYREHYRSLCDACDRSLGRIEEAFSAWVSKE